MAYISISTPKQVAAGNAFTVNGSDPVRIYGSGGDTYKLKDGEYKVVIVSASGEAWECEADLNIRRASSACLNIRLAVDGNGNIADMEFAVTYLNTQQEGAYMFFPKLKPTYSASSAAKKEESVEFSDEPDGDAPVQESAANVGVPTKGGTGWIVAGVVFLLAGLSNIGNLKVLIGGCVVGAVLLLVGIKKKKNA